jgi:hypothetical protein
MMEVREVAFKLVPDDGGQRGLEGFPRTRKVRALEEERLIEGCVAPQAVAADGREGEVDLDASEPVCPSGRDGKIVAEDPSMPGVIAAAQIDHGPGGEDAKIELAGSGQGGSGGSGFGGADPTSAPSRDKAITGLLDLAQRRVMEAQPDLLLPKAIEVFDEVLHPVFGLGGEDRRDA